MQDSASFNRFFQSLALCQKANIFKGWK